MKNTIVSIITVSCLSLLCLMFCGCGTFGGTKVVSVPMSNMPRGPFAQIHTGTVTLAANATKLDAVGVYPVGEFSKKDLRNIDKSLSKAFCTIQQSQEVDSARNLTIHVMIRRYLVAASNNDGGTLACVSWCAVNQDDQIVYDEQFYASYSSHFSTLGRSKNKVNLAIVSRIAEVSAYLASPNPRKHSIKYPENAYATISPAIEDLPEVLYSCLYANVGGSIISASAGGTTEWEWAAQNNRVNWAAYLKANK